MNISIPIVSEVILFSTLANKELLSIKATTASWLTKTEGKGVSTLGDVAGVLAKTQECRVVQGKKVVFSGQRVAPAA